MSLVIELEQRGTVGMLLLQMNIVNLRLLGCVSTILANINLNHKIRNWKIIIKCMHRQMPQLFKQLP